MADAQLGSSPEPCYLKQCCNELCCKEVNLSFMFHP